MELSRIFVVLFMLAAIGFLNGAANEVCEEIFETNLPTKICKTQETPEEIQEKIMQELEKNLWLNKFKQDPIEDDCTDVPFGDPIDDCMAVTTIEEPYAIQVNSSLHYVVQSDKHLFRQKIKVTKCMNLNHSCLGSVYSSNNDNIVETHCREKTGAVSVYVYSPEKEKIVYKSFELPVCCSCLLKQRN